jgi:hypothetical protein
MRKTLLLLLFLTSLSSKSQTHWLGFEGGYVMSRYFPVGGLTGKTSIGHSYKFGLNYEMVFRKKYFFGADFLFANKKAVNDYESLHPTDTNVFYSGWVNQQFNLNYLSFPIKGGFYFGNGVQFRLGFALIPSFLVDAKYKANYEGGQYTILGAKETITKTTPKFDCSAQIELGLTVPISQHKFFMNVGYCNSLIPFSYKGGINGFYVDHKNLMRGLFIDIGFRFRLNLFKVDQFPIQE